MKKMKYSPIIRNALCLCMAFTWWFSAELPSLLFFGEYPYPKKED